MSVPELLSEPWIDLARRHIKRAKAAGRDVPTGEDVFDAARKRVDALIALARVSKPNFMANQRQWETRWDPQHEWDRLQGAFGRYGWTPQVMDGRSTSPRHDAKQVEASRAALLYRGDYEDEHAALPKEIREYAIEVRDLLVIGLAAELFDLLVEKMGKPPRDPWVDELALPLFQQELLGLPFNPLALRLARGA